MAKTCAVCGKTKSKGHTRKLLRGHRNITSTRDFKPNLQPAAYEGRQVLACAKCIKTLIRKQAAGK